MKNIDKALLLLLIGLIIITFGWITGFYDIQLLGIGVSLIGVYYDSKKKVVK